MCPAATALCQPLHCIPGRDDGCPRLATTPLDTLMEACIVCCMYLQPGMALSRRLERSCRGTCERQASSGPQALGSQAHLLRRAACLQALQRKLAAAASQVPSPEAAASQVPSLEAAATQVPSLEAAATQVPSLEAAASQVPSLEARSREASSPTQAGAGQGATGRPVPAAAGQLQEPGLGHADLQARAVELDGAEQVQSAAGAQQLVQPYEVRAQEAAVDAAASDAAAAAAPSLAPLHGAEQEAGQAVEHAASAGAGSAPQAQLASRQACRVDASATVAQVSEGGEAAARSQRRKGGTGACWWLLLWQTCSCCRGVQSRARCWGHGRHGADTCCVGHSQQVQGHSSWLDNAAVGRHVMPSPTAMSFCGVEGESFVMPSAARTCCTQTRAACVQQWSPWQPRTCGAFIDERGAHMRAWQSPMRACQSYPHTRTHSAPSRPPPNAAAVSCSHMYCAAPLSCVLSGCAAGLCTWTEEERAAALEGFALYGAVRPPHRPAACCCPRACLLVPYGLSVCLCVCGCLTGCLPGGLRVCLLAFSPARRPACVCFHESGRATGGSTSCGLRCAAPHAVPAPAGWCTPTQLSTASARDQWHAISCHAVPSLLLLLLPPALVPAAYTAAAAVVACSRLAACCGC
jgi:hypothetical protein